MARKSKKAKKRKQKEAYETDDRYSQWTEEFVGEKAKKEAKRCLGILLNPDIISGQKVRGTFFGGDSFWMSDARRLGGETVAGCVLLGILEVNSPPLSSLQARIAPHIARIIRGVKPVAETTLWDLLEEESELSHELCIEGIRTDASTCRRALNLKIGWYTMSTFDKKFGADSQSKDKKIYKVFLDADNCGFPGCVVLFGGNYFVIFELRANGDGGALPCKHKRKADELKYCGGWEVTSQTDAKFYLCSGKNNESVNSKETLLKCKVQVFALSSETDLFPADDFLVFKRKGKEPTDIVEKLRVSLKGDIAKVPAESILKALAARNEVIDAQKTEATNPMPQSKRAKSAVTSSSMDLDDACTVAASQPPFVASKASTSSLKSSTESTTDMKLLKALESKVLSMEGKMKAMEGIVNAQNCELIEMRDFIEALVTVSLEQGRLQQSGDVCGDDETMLTEEYKVDSTLPPPSETKTESHSETTSISSVSADSDTEMTAATKSMLELCPTKDSQSVKRNMTESVFEK